MVCGNVECVMSAGVVSRDLGKAPKVVSFVGTQCIVRRGDGSFVHIKCVPSHSTRALSEGCSCVHERSIVKSRSIVRR